MEISLTTPAMLFPAVSLLLLAYTNRFLAIANTVRMLHTRYQKEGGVMLRRQLDNLRRRLKLIKYMQVAGVISLILCLCAVIALFRDFQIAGKYLFGLSLGAMLLSLVFCLSEVLISGRALDIELEVLRRHTRVLLQHLT